jgi:hypothetical protein
VSNGGTIELFLLPYIEQQNLFGLFNLKTNPEDQTFPSATTRLDSTVISTFVCPSDDHPPLSDLFNIPNSNFDFRNRAHHNDVASGGPSTLVLNPASACTENWNSWALGSSDTANNFPGPFTRNGNSRPTRIADITDGLSNTIFFGEVRPKCSHSNSRGWLFSNNGNGLVSTTVPINYDSCSQSAAAGCKCFFQWMTELGFKSAHPGGAQFLLGDGSVHFLPQTINHQIYQYLGAKSDGNVVQLP